MVTEPPSRRMPYKSCAMMGTVTRQQAASSTFAGREVSLIFTHLLISCRDGTEKISSHSEIYFPVWML